MKINKFLLPFLIGLVGIFSFAPFSIKFLIFVSYGYLINVLLNSRDNTFWKIFCWGIGHWGFGMSWLIVSVYYYGETTLALSTAIYILLVCILTIVFTCPIFFIKSASEWLKINNKIHKVLFISALLSISELSRYYFLNGVPWLIPGSIFLDTYTQNIYPLLGVSALSFLIYLICTSIVVSNNNKALFFLLPIVVLTLIPEEKSVITEDGLLVSIVQPASDPFLKYKGDYYSQIEKNLHSLIDITSEDSKLIVIPEAELPYLLDNQRFDDFLRKTTKSEKIIMGSWEYQDNSLYNSIYSPKYDESYKKTHLVPFGEYIPFIDGLRGLIGFFDLPMSNVSHGSRNQQNIRLLNDIKVATPICFDIAFPNTVRLMNKSSLLMINISNDTWFGNSIGPYHHLDISRIRSIENNRWTIRATNDGISALISNYGTIVDYLDKGESTILEGTVNLIDEVSFFNQIGYLLTYIFLFIIVISTILWSIWKNFAKN